MGVTRAASRVLAIAAAGAIITLPSVAHAQDAAAAEVLFEHGRALLNEGKFAEACPKLEESLRLDPGIGTMLYLAECWRRAGKTASAWLEFREAEARCMRDNDPRAKIAHDRAEMLLPLLSMIAVRVAPSPGLTVTRDGRAVDPSQWGTETAIDPGEHVFRATAPGYNPWESRVTVGVTASHAVVLVPALEIASASGAATEPRPDPDAEAAASLQRTIGFVVGGLGIVGLGVGSYFGLSAIAKNGRADEHCNNLDCDAEGVRLGDDAKQHATISTISVIAGLALVAGGVVLVLTAPRSRSAAVSTTQSRVRPRTFGFSF